jgi:hydroxymethylpyrimidine pyrophosphatase-like HAD family hydrolase
LQAKVSSIHVNGWFGDYDKLAMTRRLFSVEFAVDLAREREAIAYVGDSPNDAPMFEFFPHSIGVANVRRFAGVIATPPKYITRASAGAGFVEVVAHLLGA